MHPLMIYPVIYNKSCLTLPPCLSKSLEGVFTPSFLTGAESKVAYIQINLGDKLLSLTPYWLDQRFISLNF